jgi:plasmid stabilization system protein ParE
LPTASSDYDRAAAEEYLQGIDRELVLAAEHPGIGVVHPDLDPPLRSLPYCSHRPYHHAEIDRIFVLRVLHRAMDVSRWLAG